MTKSSECFSGFAPRQGEYNEPPSASNQNLRIILTGAQESRTDVTTPFATRTDRRVHRVLSAVLGARTPAGPSASGRGRRSSSSSSGQAEEPGVGQRRVDRRRTDAVSRSSAPAATAIRARATARWAKSSNPKPSNLSDADWKHGATDGEIFTVIRDGVKSTGMKPFGQQDDRRISSGTSSTTSGASDPKTGTPLKIVVADDLPASALELLRGGGWLGRRRAAPAASRTRWPPTSPDADALLVRSATKVDRRAAGRPRRACASSRAPAPASTTSTSPPPAPAASWSSTRRAPTASASPSTPAR